ncbi:MAG: M24 family metallopeptidase [Candidatus Puniceispirillaceae bacterium]
MSGAAKLLHQLRDVLAQRGLDGFYLTRADRFQGEEVQPADEYLAYLTGFTGSAGIGLVLADRAALFTDSRYGLQISRQTDKELYETFDSAHKNLAQWMAEIPAKGKVRLGYDSWTVTLSELERLPKKLGTAEVEWVACAASPLIDIWPDRPAVPKTELFLLDDGIAGRSAGDKLASAAAEIKKSVADLSLITAPDGVNWLANLRGRDLVYTPFHLCFGLLDIKGSLTLIGSAAKEKQTGYASLSWAGLASYLSRHKGAKISCDPASLPVAMHEMLIEAGLEPVLRPEPVLAQKAIKNTAEIDGFREAHLRDGIALCHFWHWLENSALDGGLSEADIADRLTEFRRVDKSYICDSFATIAGFRGNGAIVHYRAIKGQDSQLNGAGVLLIDSGAHYQMGTTDITRTFFFGSPEALPDKAAIAHASAVLAAHIELARARFPKGTTGAQLDAICRAPLWAKGLDFGHGTGHGVGHILSVHEGPVSISKRCHLAVEAGMILSNEPGYYAEEHYGIRHENLVLAREASDGFMAFETLTCFPFDVQLVDAGQLSAEQTAWLNDYHRRVYAHLSPHLTPDLATWLKGKCAPL